MNNTPETRLPKGAKAVQEWLTMRNYELQVVELPNSTRTASDAAEAIGCEIGQIVKSLIFQTLSSQRPVLILVSGSNRVNEPKIRKHLGEGISKAEAQYVRDLTGFAIGGIPPVAHKQDLNPIIDEDLLSYEYVWAAAGTPFSVFRLTPDQLLEMTDGLVMGVS